MRLRIEYDFEGANRAKALELYSVGTIRKLTYEGMDEVLKADVQEDEIAYVARALESVRIDAFPPDDDLLWLADSVTIRYESSKGNVTYNWTKSAPPQWEGLLNVCSVLDDLKSKYFRPRFY